MFVVAQDLVSQELVGIFLVALGLIETIRQAPPL